MRLWRLQKGQGENLAKALKQRQDIVKRDGLRIYCDMIFDMGIERQFLHKRGKRHGNKRIRRKKLKREIRKILDHQILDCFEQVEGDE